MSLARPSPLHHRDAKLIETGIYGGKRWRFVFIYVLVLAYFMFLCVVLIIKVQLFLFIATIVYLPLTCLQLSPVE